MLKILTKKLCTLLCLLSWQRSQLLQTLKLETLLFSNGRYIIYLDRVIITTRPGHHQQRLEYREIPQNKKICAAHFLKKYINRINLIGENMDNRNQLPLSYVYPHNPVNS